jgi:hypothetical protein
MQGFKHSTQLSVQELLQPKKGGFWLISCSCVTGNEPVRARAWAFAAALCLQPKRRKILAHQQQLLAQELLLLKQEQPTKRRSHVTSQTQPNCKVIQLSNKACTSDGVQDAAHLLL